MNNYKAISQSELLIIIKNEHFLNPSHAGSLT